MNLKLVKPIVKIVSKAKFKAINKAPELCFIGGTVAGLGALVVMYKQAIKFQDILKEHNETLDSLEHRPETYKAEIEAKGLIYNEDTIKGLRRHVYVKTVTKTATNFLPVFALAGTSLCLYGKAFGILIGRYFSLAAVYAGALERNKVLEEKLSNQLLSSKGQDANVNEEGTENASTKSPLELDANAEDIRLWPYSKFFDEANENWEKNPESNRRFLYGKQQFLEDKLNRNGYLFLNTAYEMLGFPPTQAGAIMGWKKYKTDEEAEFHGAANHVSIGLFNDTQSSRNFINGWEDSILLHFNIDPEPILGLVYPKV